MFLLDEITQFLASIGVVLVCVALFVGTYLLNKKTKKPEGCEDVSEHCEGCSLVNCSHHPENKEKGEDSND